VSFEVMFEGVKWWWDSDKSRYIVPDLWISRGESTTAKVVFYPGNMQEGLATPINLVLTFYTTPVKDYMMAVKRIP